jgi:hypothetical protein
MQEESVSKDKPQKPDWKFKVKTIAGETHSLNPKSVEAHKDNIATEFRYEKGEMPDLWIKESGGGGATIVPYVLINVELYVGAGQQFRELTGSLVTGVPRGFKGKDRNHDEAAKGEFEEEAGAKESLSSRIYRFKGQPVNVNSTFFKSNPHKGEGHHFYGLRFEPDEVVLRRDSKTPLARIFVLNPDLRDEVKEVSEKIKPEGLRFFHVDLLQNTSDGFTLIALARLQSELRRKSSQV